MSRVRTYGPVYCRLLVGFLSVFAFLASVNVARAQSYTVLADFGQQDEGWRPQAGLLKASDGNFYGTTANGGYGYGTIFKITPSGTLTTVYRFRSTDGSDP